jgi:arabinan endo-1,5-alpha-L-arabinosidase
VWYNDSKAILRRLKMIINRVISAFAAVVCFITSIFGISDAEKPAAKQYEIKGSGSCNTSNGRISIHDPSIIQDADGTYYIFGTHGCGAKSDDMINWTSFACGVHDNNRMLVREGKTLREALKEPFSWTDAYQLTNGCDENSLQTNIWAADVIYNEKMGKYCYYASSSVWVHRAQLSGLQQVIILKVHMNMRMLLFIQALTTRLMTGNTIHE